MKVEILEGCTGCGLCASISSDVFKVNATAHADNSKVKGNESACRSAAEQCPVNVIKIHE